MDLLQVGTQGSFTPPLVVMAVRAEGSSHEIIKSTNKFSLNVLKSDQKDLAAVFFKPQKALGGRFESVEFNLGELGLPILVDSVGGVECNVVGSVMLWRPYRFCRRGSICLSE